MYIPQQSNAHLLPSIRAADRLSQSEEIALIKQAQQQKQKTQGRMIREKIIKANIRLVASVAYRVSKAYKNQKLELDDLIQEGVLGLNRAIDKFDPKKGCQFSTYSYPWIKQCITRAIENDGTIRIPIHVRRIQRKIRKLQAQKPGAHQRTIAEELNIPENKYEVLAREVTSLNEYISQNGDKEFIEFISDSANTAEAYITGIELRERMESLLAELPPLQAQILKLLFGWNQNPMNYTEIAKKLNLNYCKVRRLTIAALKSMKERAAPMKDYLS